MEHSYASIQQSFSPFRFYLCVFSDEACKIFWIMMSEKGTSWRKFKENTIFKEYNSITEHARKQRSGVLWSLTKESFWREQDSPVTKIEKERVKIYDDAW